MTRPRLAVAPGSGPSAVSVFWSALASSPVSEAEHGAGETRVGVTRPWTISPGIAAHTAGLLATPKAAERTDGICSSIGPWRHDHAAVQRGSDRPAVLAGEHAGSGPRC